MASTSLAGKALCSDQRFNVVIFGAENSNGTSRAFCTMKDMWKILILMMIFN